MALKVDAGEPVPELLMGCFFIGVDWGMPGLAVLSDAEMTLDSLTLSSSVVVIIVILGLLEMFSGVAVPDPTGVFGWCIWLGM